MTQENKDLLLKDLSARLPYSLIIHLVELNEDEELYCLNIPQEGLYTRSLEHNNVTTLSPIEDIKPYLRPMSSMTEEEEDEFFSLSRISHELNEYGDETVVYGIQLYPQQLGFEVIDWLNSHHFDYRGLIEKGLAIEAVDIYNP